MNAEYPRFIKVAAKILRDHAGAEDAVLEGLRKALDNLDQFRGSCGFLPWLTRIVINESLVSRRKDRVQSRYFTSLSTTMRDAHHQPSLTTVSLEAGWITGAIRLKS